MNSYLRHVLDPRRPGLERFVSKRGIILRDPRDVISSTMNRGNRSREDFGAVCRKVLHEYDRLLQLRAYSPISYETFLFHRMTTELDYLAGIAAWAGLQVNRSRLSVSQRINQNSKAWFPKLSEWDRELRRTYDMTLERVVTMWEDHRRFW